MKKKFAQKFLNVRTVSDIFYGKREENHWKSDD